MKPKNRGELQDDELREAIADVSERLNADFLLYAGRLYGRNACWGVEEAIAKLRRKRPNIVVFLTTLGGVADEAFRIARCIQEHYSEGQFILFVGSWCKSAGTLIALGANEIIMTNRAELGPLDVQVFKKDEVGERTSGLTPTQALSNLQVQV